MILNYLTRLFQAKRGEPEIEEGIISQETGNILYQNIPNPFSSKTTIEFFIKEKCPVQIKVSDVLGRVIAVLVDEVKSKGHHKVIFSLDEFHSGLYYYSLEACGEVLTKQMQIIK